MGGRERRRLLLILCWFMDLLVLLRVYVFGLLYICGLLLRVVASVTVCVSVAAAPHCLHHHHHAFCDDVHTHSYPV